MTQPKINDLIYSGARGTISDITTPTGLVRYRSDQAGASLPFVYRTDLPVAPNRPQVADTSDFMSAFISYGQSWRSHALPVDWQGLKLTNGGEEYFAFGPQIVNGTDLLPNIGMPFFTNLYGDLRNLNWQNTANSLPDNASGSIGYVAARTMVRLCKTANYPRFPIVDCGTAYPGYTWPQLQPGTDPWTATTQAATKIKAINTAYGKTTRWLGVGFTHGAFDQNDSFDYYTQLQAMVAAFDGLALNTFTGGTGDTADPNGAANGALHYYTDMYAGTSGMTVQYANTLRQKDFGISDFGKIHLVGPRYPYPFSDDIHHSGLGYVQYGEVEGLAKFYTHVYGIAWNPLYVLSATVLGNKVTLLTSAAMLGFGDLAIDTTQIEKAPGWGLKVIAGGTVRTVTGVSVTGPNTIDFTLDAAVPSGTSTEVSYAWYGPGSTPGQHAGVWGNIKRRGPPSVWFLNKTIDTWLCNYKQTVTAT